MDLGLSAATAMYDMDVVVPVDCAAPSCDGGTIYTVGRSIVE